MNYTYHETFNHHYKYHQKAVQLLVMVHKTFHAEHAFDDFAIKNVAVCT